MPVKEKDLKPFIIAEIGSNWKKYPTEKENWAMLRQQVVAAKSAGADAIKFQLFTAFDLFGPEVVNTETQTKVDKYALPDSWIRGIWETCEEEGIEFMCSAFSAEGYSEVDPFVKRHKVASPEAVAEDIYLMMPKFGKPVIWSNGCGGKVNRRDDVLMYCVSDYPAKAKDYLLPLGVVEEWGLSDHTKGNDVAIDARRRGCTYFEKHVDFFKGIGEPTPDTCVSSTGSEFYAYVQAIRQTEPVDVRAKQRESRKAYGRRQTEHGWYRPLPS